MIKSDSIPQFVAYLSGYSPIATTKEQEQLAPMLLQIMLYNLGEFHVMVYFFSWLYPSFVV